jgi:hypothetical protein
MPADPTHPGDQPTIGFDQPAASHPVAHGERFGDYVLEVELGRGGMGVVYKAHEPALNRHVALKMILSGSLSGEQELSRFKAEATAAAKLHHPNIVKVHHIGVHDGQNYFSMDFIDGVSLAQKLSDGPLPVKAAARHVFIIAQAIQHAHDHGILHRDLKPGNVLLDADDVPHVTDFGLAKHLGGDHGQTRTGALLGTPSYMAPEQARGDKQLGPATDVYGLGALLYELITARPPFRGETPLDTVIQVLENEPAPPRLLNPRIDRDLETVCLKCLAKNPRDRYASAAELAEDLRRFLDGETISARTMNVLDYVSRTLERSQFDVEFKPYGNLMLWFAFVVGLSHVVKHFLISFEEPFWTVATAYVGQFALMAVGVYFGRPKGFLPTTTAERLLWSVWLGYVLTCMAVGHLTRVMFGMQAVYDKKIYPFYAVISGLAFFVLGSSYWGKLYAVAAAFFALAFVMQTDLYWATLEFGAVWTVALCLIGLHLRRLGEQRQTEAGRHSSK